MKIDKSKLWDGYKKEDKILIASVLDKYQKFIRSGKSQHTSFLNPHEFNIVKKTLEERKIEYQIIQKHEECEQKVIVFGNDTGPVTIYWYKFIEPLKHSDVLGTLFSIGYEKDMIGDIFIEEDGFYLTNLSRLNQFLEENLYQIKNQIITLEKKDEIILKKERYEPISLIVSSRRLDQIISGLAKTSRKESNDLITKGNVILNYQEKTTGTTLLKEGDIISIRRVGKFRLSKVLGTTRKEKEVLEFLKYK